MNKVTPSCIFPWLKAAVCMLFLLGLSGVVHAAPPVVKTVPWVATNPLIPHDTYSGKQITLKGTADVQGTNIKYSWDFGDGNSTPLAQVTNQYVIEATHTYTGATGTIFTARLIVQNTDTGETGSQAYYVEIRDKTLQTEVNVAIDEGLWYLHKTMYRFTGGDGLAKGDWTQCSPSGNPYGCYATDGYYGGTAVNVNAFEVNGHLESGDSSNPYVETVQRGMRRVFEFLASETISPKTYFDIGTVNPDSGGGTGGVLNGRGVYVNQSYYPYQGGMFMDAIIASGTPGAVTITGDTNIKGRAYKNIVQDMVDDYAHGQYSAGGGNSAAVGGWRYVWEQSPDNSACQWAAIGLIAAERTWGLTVPPWVKSENANHWLSYSQASNGAFGYGGPDSNDWGLTPSGMVQLVMSGIGRGDQRWDKAETYARNQFTNIEGYRYALFSFVKAMLLHEVNGVPAPIKILQSQTSGVLPIDWYAAETSKGDPLDGVARILINSQNYGGKTGSWYGNANGDSNYFVTAWSIIMLNRTLFQGGAPVAVATATPNPGVASETITLDGTASFHQDTARHIVSWLWTFDNGTTATGPVVTHSWPAVGNYPVVLKVTDDATPPASADTTVTVQITTPPIAPTANAGGPYVFCPQAKPWFLDGSKSVNPDESQHQAGSFPGDTIYGNPNQFAWDLNGQGTFSDTFGTQPDVTTIFTAKGVGNYLIQLKVTDTTAASFPASGLGNLSDTASSQVSVKNATDTVCTSCIKDLAARPKSGKVQLTWTAVTGAHHYNVYRSTVQGGPYTFLATTASTYSTYLDTSVVNNTTYYYVVRPATLNNAETCQSNEASAKPTGR